MENSSTASNTENIITDSWQDYQGDQLRQLRKKINRSRNAVFIVAGLTLAGGFLQMAIQDEFSTDDVLFTILIAVIFTGLGFLANLRPYGALIMALIIYAGLWLANIIIDPTYLVKGIIVKAAVIYFLASGIPHAKEAEKIKKELKALE